MAAVKNLMVRCGADFSGLTKATQKAQVSMNSMQKSAGALKNSLSKIGIAAAAVFSVKAIVNFGKQAVELGSNIAEVQNVVDTAFGDMAYKAEVFADTAIEKFGMSALSAKKTASTYMAMAKSLGMSSESASDMAISLAGLTGDIASFYNISQEAADTKLKSVFTGETETLKELGVVMTQANLDAFAMANGFGKTTSKMTQAEKVQLRYAYVTQQLSMAQGDFAKTSGSWANQTRILTERWNEFKSVIGQALINVLTPALQILNQLIAAMSNLAKTMMSAFGGQSSKSVKSAEYIASASAEIASGFDSATESAEKLKRATAGFDEMNILSSDKSSGATSASGGISSIASPSLDFSEPDTSGVKSAADKIKLIFSRINDFIKKKFAPTFKSWGGAFEKLKEPLKTTFGSIKTSISGLLTSLAPVGSYIIDGFIPNISIAFSETFAPIFTDVMSFALDQFGKDFEFLCTQIDNYVNDVWEPSMETLETVATDAMRSISDVWWEKGDALMQKLGEMRDSFKKIWTNIYENIIRPIVDNVITKVRELWDNSLQPLWDNVVRFFASLGECVMTVWNNFLGPIVNWIIEKVAPAIRNVINRASDLIFSFFHRFATIVTGIIKALRGVLDFFTGVFSRDWKKAWEGIKTAISGVWDAIWSKVKGSINLIIDGINLLWTGIYSTVTALVNSIGSVVKTVGDLLGKDWGFSRPEEPPLIPKLANGGIATRATNAIIGEAGREAILPLENNTEWMDLLADRIASRNKSPSTLILKIGEREFGRVAIDAINSNTLQTGRLNLVMA